jgi:cystathionine gamma-lyase
VLGAPFHLRGDADDAGYGRYANPTWTALEAALGELEGGHALVFASGMAAVSAILLDDPGDCVVIPSDGYPAVRAICHERLAPHGVEVREVPTDTDAIVAACDGASLVWVETPSNPRLDVCDLRAAAAAAHAAGARLVVDNTLATALGQPVLDLGADVAVTAGTKALAGHSDILFGVVASRSRLAIAQARAFRTQTGAILGPLEAWLALRSLPTLALRLARASANALAIAQRLQQRGLDVFHPSLAPAARAQMAHFGPVVSFDLGSEERAQAFLDASELISEATSFGGVHTTAERRARWGGDAVGPGFVRLSAGIEDTVDLLADLDRALGG